MILQIGEILLGISILWMTSDYVSRRLGVRFGYICGVVSLGLGAYLWIETTSGISSLFFLIFIFGGLAALVAAERVEKQGKSGALKAPSTRQAGLQRPESNPTVITNHYTTDNRVFVDARSFTSVNIINIEDARQVFQLPLGFSQRQLIKAYDARRKKLERQASRLPRGDAENRRLLTAEQDRVEEAFLRLTHETQ